MRLVRLLLVIFIISSLNAFAQKKKIIEDASNKEAKDNFSSGNYYGAMQDYEELYKKEPQNITYNMRLGVCYLNTNINKTFAVGLLEFVTQEEPDNSDAFYQLGRAYMYDLRYDDAIEAFKTSIQVPKNRQKYDISAERQIEMCHNAIELLKKPVDVTFENMGPGVNSPAPDYNPFIPDDESFMVFSTKRKANQEGVLGFDGHNPPDVYMAFLHEDEYVKSKSVGANINTPYKEEVVGLSHDGDDLFIYIDNDLGFEDIVVGTRKGKGFTKLEGLGSNINTSKDECAASETGDKNTIYFTRNVGSGNGGKEIFSAKKLPDGGWSTPVNIGKPINTEYDEDFPLISEDGKTLYFCSTGHNSMGGYDIFKASWNDSLKNWNEPENLGYPINNSDDNMSIVMSKSGRYGYMSAFRDEGEGDLDIYRVTFNSVKPVETVVKGALLFNDTISNIYKKHQKFSNIKTNPSNEIEINVADRKGKKMGTYRPNRETGKYVMILPPGKYGISVKNENFQSYTDSIKVFGFGSYKPEITKNIILKSK